LAHGEYAKALEKAIKANDALSKMTSSCSIAPNYLHILENKLLILHLLAKYREVRSALETYCPEKLPSRLLLRKQRIEARLHLVESTDRYELAVKLFSGIRNSNLFKNSDHWRAMEEYATALMLRGNLNEAEAQSRDSLGLKNKHLGANHRDTLSSAHTLAEILLRAGKFDEGLNHIQQAYHGRHAIIGEEHPETFHSKCILATYVFNKAATLGDYDGAEFMLRDCSSSLSKSLSASHPLVLASESTLALVLFAQGKYSASEKLNGSVLAKRQKGPWIEPKTHPDTLTSMHQLMTVLRLGGRLSAADEMSKFLLDERTRVLTKGTQDGTDLHPDQLISLRKRAIILSLSGGQAMVSEATSLHAEALEMIELAMDGSIAILGTEHPDTF
jgi:tetratricopeptide (TPR) repeat protein